MKNDKIDLNFSLILKSKHIDFFFFIILRGLFDIILSFLVLVKIKS